MRRGEDEQMDPRETMTHLRSLIWGGRSDELVAWLSREQWPEDSLQLIGDGLLIAIRHAGADASEVTTTCVEALRDRDWEGDEELADGLDAALRRGPTPMLRPLPVDLEELAMILEGDPVSGGGRVDLSTGDVWPQPSLEYAEEAGELDEDDSDGWLWVHCEGSRSGYRDMVQFIDKVDDPALADRLDRAITGRGAFRRFKDTLSAQPELMTRWHAFSNDRQRGRARSWLATQGYTPTIRRAAAT